MSELHKLPFYFKDRINNYAPDFNIVECHKLGFVINSHDLIDYLYSRGEFSDFNVFLCLIANHVCCRPALVQLLEENYPGCVYLDIAEWKLGACIHSTIADMNTRYNERYGIPYSKIDASKLRQHFLEKIKRQPNRRMFVPYKQ